MAPLLLLKLSSALLLLALLFPHGHGEGGKCSVKNIDIKQVKTGRVVEGRREYEVTVSNRCKCPQSKVVVECFGLSSVVPVDQRVIVPIDDTNCVMNGGWPIRRGSPIKFRYAWMTPLDFRPVSSRVQC